MLDRDFIVRRDMFIEVLRDIYFDNGISKIVKIAKLCNLYRPIYFTEFVGTSSILI